MAGALSQRWVVVDGQRVCCLESGSGPELLLLASMLVRARTYRPLTKRLTAHFRVLAVELPGCGRASRLERPWSFEQYADFSARLVEVLGLTRPVVLGHSNSGAVALLLAARHPERVGALVLADTVGARRQRALWRVVLARSLDGVLELGLTVRASWHLLSNVVRHPCSFLHQVREGARAGLLEEAARVRAPVLLAWGRHDHTMPPECAERLCERLPWVRLQWGRGSHDWLVTDSDGFARQLVAFARGPQPALPSPP